LTPIRRDYISSEQAFARRGGDTITLSTNAAVWWITSDRVIAQTWLNADPPDPTD